MKKLASFVELLIQMLIVLSKISAAFNDEKLIHINNRNRN